MSAYSKDGSTFVTETIERTAYRWAKYKPDGARQMGKPGRWQKQVWSGDYFKWENCDDPEGELSPPIEDGPISKAFKHAGALEHWLHEVGKLQSQLAARDEENKRLRDRLESIDVYGSDTLSGRVDGRADKDWYREAVREMRNHARAAIAKAEGRA